MGYKIDKLLMIMARGSNTSTLGFGRSDMSKKCTANPVSYREKVLLRLLHMILQEQTVQKV